MDSFIQNISPVLLTATAPVLFYLLLSAWKIVTRAEETKNEAAVDAFLEGKESRRSSSVPIGDDMGAREDGQAEDGRAKVVENRDSLARQKQAILDQRLAALERRQVIADDRNFALLRTYHSQGLAQSKISFWFSLTLGVAGFGLIVWAVVLMMRSGDPLNAQERATVPLIAGTVTQAVSTLFFVQSNHTRKVMTTFFDKLRLDRNLDESLRLIDSVRDPALQGSLQAVIAMHLVDSSIQPSILPGFGQSPSALTDSSADRKRARKGSRTAQDVPKTQALAGDSATTSARSNDKPSVDDAKRIHSDQP